MQTQNTRYFLVDGIRGFAVINMVLFHFCYDVFIVYGKNPLWYNLPAAHLWQQMICRTFIFISGFVWAWGRKTNAKRGLLLNLYGFAITLVTLAAMPTEAVWFGILNFIGCAVLLMFPVQKAVQKIPPVLGFCACFLLFILCKSVPDGYIRIAALFRIQLPDYLYSIKILTPLGFPFPGFYSSDYFPMLPWFFLYLCGYFFQGVFAKHDSWQRAARRKIPLLSAAGTKAIWIYLIHQPVCMLICMLIFC